MKKMVWKWLLLGLLVASGVMIAQQWSQSAIQLQAAIRKESVDGDLGARKFPTGFEVVEVQSTTAGAFWTAASIATVLSPARDATTRSAPSLMASKWQ